jgi:hypothetical protein
MIWLRDEVAAIVEYKGAVLNFARDYFEHKSSST